MATERLPKDSRSCPSPPPLWRLRVSPWIRNWTPPQMQAELLLPLPGWPLGARGLVSTQPQQVRCQCSHPPLLLEEAPKIRFHGLQMESVFTFGQGPGRCKHQRPTTAASLLPSPWAPTTGPLLPAGALLPEPTLTSPCPSVLMNRLSVFSFAFFFMAWTTRQQPSCACQVQCIGVGGFSRGTKVHSTQNKGHPTTTCTF